VEPNFGLVRRQRRRSGPFIEQTIDADAARAPAA
jgi:hypothetical protein